jgi:hypothetical protein
MKINILKMQFVDKRTCFLDSLVDQILDGKRTHLIVTYTGLMPARLTYLTSRIQDKKLKHKHRPIPVRIRNKNNVNPL